MTKVFHEINKDLKNYLHTLFRLVTEVIKLLQKKNINLLDLK